MKIICVCCLAVQLVYTSVPKDIRSVFFNDENEKIEKIEKFIQKNHSPHIEHEFSMSLSGTDINPNVSWDGSSGPWSRKAYFPYK